MKRKSIKREEEPNKTQRKIETCKPKTTKNVNVSFERARCEAFACSCMTRVGDNSPAQLLATDPMLLRFFWLDFVHSKTKQIASQILSWGENASGQLGLGDTTKRSTPDNIQFFSGKRIAQICCGKDHSMCLLDTNQLFIWGGNRFGQLGLGDIPQQSRPVEMSFFKDKLVVDITCGCSNSMVLIEEEKGNEIFAWGNNDIGQLGIGDTIARNTPIQIPILNGKNISKIVSGGGTCFAILYNGSVFAWGLNQFGQLGLGDQDVKTIPELIVSLSGKFISKISGGFSHTLALSDEGEILIVGYIHFDNSSEHTILTTFQPVHELKGKQFVGIACGSRHCLALENNGKLYSWGENLSGELGLGDNETRETPQIVESLIGQSIASIACGFHQSVALLENGEAYVWGWNSHGQLGTCGTYGKIDVEQLQKYLQSGDNRTIQQRVIEDFHNDRIKPEVVGSLKGKHIFAIIFGFDFSMALAL